MLEEIGIYLLKGHVLWERKSKLLNHFLIYISLDHLSYNRCPLHCDKAAQHQNYICLYISLFFYNPNLKFLETEFFQLFDNYPLFQLLQKNADLL